MSNAIFQQESHNSALRDYSRESLDTNSLLVDPNLHSNDAGTSAGLLDAQFSQPIPENFDHFVDAIDWQALGDAQSNTYPSVEAMEAGVQDVYTPLVETDAHSIPPARDTFAENLPLQNISLEDESNAFEDTDFQAQTTYNYPNPLESSLPVQDPYFNSPHIASSQQTYNTSEDNSSPFLPGIGFEHFDSLGQGFPTTNNAQLDATCYDTPNVMPFGHEQTLDPSLTHRLATMEDPDPDLISSFAGEKAYQAFQPPDIFHDPYLTTTLGRYMYNPNISNNANYAQHGNFPSEVSSMPTSSTHYSPHRQTSSSYYAGQASPSPIQDEYEDSGSDYSDEQSSHPRRPARRRVLTRKGSKEKPKIPKDKPWIRINKETRGGTSRTLKINNYNPDEMYEQLPHPIGPWSAGHGRRKFEYSSHHELADREMTVARLKHFIQWHPRTDDCKLTLYIQRTPADSKRRYGSDQTERCRFEDCPARVYGKSVASRGLITPGNYRVAFDEFSHGYRTNQGSRADPFKVAFFVHLYCLERFLDFPALCRLDNISVEADNRQALRSEPNAKFGAALLGPELKIAASFIDACRSGNLRSPNGEWTNYPHHTKIGSEIKWKDHYDTLNYRLQNSKNTIRSSKVQRQGKLTNIAMHCGNLDVVHKAMKEIYKTPKDVPGWRYTDKHGVFTGERNDPPEGWILDPRESVKPPRPRQKRQMEEIESDEEDENERSNKMARTGEYTYGGADGTYQQPGFGDDYSARQDYPANAFYNPAVYRL
ncbi:hypothetical protein E2P81_ATG10941 [Venturia nashicola]|uniref:Uncharacterized protein n=1 Tax=Venturia nashicola TaxID=86259 RepID=A0A4Z1NWY0_9PEZI|nr:hypothetical protein E6O75_ATG10617 [Venturia nashicola]TLD27653.1 hypothetical protein E2P81_ATG10941 [Venturia nashicola]